MLLEVGVDDSVVLGTDFITSVGGKDGGVLTQSEFGNDLTQLFADPTQLSSFSIAAASSGSRHLTRRHNHSYTVGFNICCQDKFKC